MWCWYHGAAFRGYQAQVEGPTVQQTLIAAMRAGGLSRNPVASGRTDAGVHARMQVLSFNLDDGVAIDDVPALINRHVPPTMGIAVARATSSHFNAHWKATAKEYRYRLLSTPRPSWQSCAWLLTARLEVLREAMQRFIGAWDFSAFHDRKSPTRIRTLFSVEVMDLGDGLVDVRLVGDGFGRHMVRYLVASAVAVAEGRLTCDQLSEALERGSQAQRPHWLTPAPAHGLVLWDVRYAPTEDPFDQVTRLAAPLVPAAPPFWVD
jgi:tRNA pseudouridine38-40 synthase